MSNLWQEWCASASSEFVHVATLELIHPAFDDDGVIRLAKSYEDIEATLETGETVTFYQAPIAVSLPQRSADGYQEIGFGIGSAEDENGVNVVGYAYRNLDAAREAGGQIRIVHRDYLYPDMSAPQTVNKAVITQAELSTTSLQVNAGYFDLINWLFCRDTYNLTFAPGLAYI